MTVVPAASAAPSFAGPTPPDRTQSGLGDHLAAALNILRTRPLTSDEMMELRAFHEAEQQIIMAATGQQGGGQPGAPGAGQPPEQQDTGGGDQSDYGSGPSTSAMNTGFGG